jgi:hypothetical protein
MNGRYASSLVAVALLGACGSAPPATMDNDAGVILQPDTGVACANHIPDPANNPGDPQFGTFVGRSFGALMGSHADFTLNDCNGNPHSFYSEGYCSPDHTFTILSIAAGWCMPCQYESSQFTDQIVSVYGPLGVRLIQIIVQDADGNPPTGAMCNQWANTYNLSVVPDASGVGNYELIDPAQITNAFYPSGYLPSTIIVDSDGIIQYYEDGTTESLAGLTAKLDQLLGR